MMQCFFMTCKTPRETTSAFPPEGISIADELTPQLDGLNKLPFELALKNIKEAKEGLLISDELKAKEIWSDYQANGFAYPLFSERMKHIIVENLTGHEGIDWITAIVNAVDEQRTYYIPRFNKKLDVLDETETTFVPGTDHIIRPCFSSQKIANYSLFHRPKSGDLWKITPSLYVHESLKKAIQKAKLTGVGFEKTRVS